MKSCLEWNALLDDLGILQVLTRLLRIAEVSHHTISILPSLLSALCLPLLNTMAVVGEALLSAAFGSLFDKLRCSDLIKLARQEDVHTDLKKWEKQLQSIRQEINDAEKKQITQEAVKSWLFDDGFGI
ncbi:hypothetical protein CK203_080706 [Vitis vinifera]|uniref:Disease resistance N-terminal domain-containing protein n=1 Tax=Vitis vinifera TaxID=29760 RepID=A0A438DZ88_VITVI|nr:hypothetical protein CK203_080706 [Vitis vinifera]